MILEPLNLRRLNCKTTQPLGFVSLERVLSDPYAKPR
jgi:hypothetical protein